MRVVVPLLRGICTRNLDDIVVIDEVVPNHLPVKVIRVQALMHVRELVAARVVTHGVARDGVIRRLLVSVLIHVVLLRAQVRLLESLAHARVVLTRGELPGWREMRLVLEEAVALRGLILALMVLWLRRFVVQFKALPLVLMLNYMIFLARAEVARNHDYIVHSCRRLELIVIDFIILIVRVLRVPLGRVAEARCTHRRRPFEATSVV